MRCHQIFSMAQPDTEPAIKNNYSVLHISNTERMGVTKSLLHFANLLKLRLQWTQVHQNWTEDQGLEALSPGYRKFESWWCQTHPRLGSQESNNWPVLLEREEWLTISLSLLSDSNSNQSRASVSPWLKKFGQLALRVLEEAFDSLCPPWLEVVTWQGRESHPMG